MKTMSGAFAPPAWVSAARGEAACWTTAFAFTFGLFLLMANIEKLERHDAPADFQDIATAAVSLDPPPLPPQPIEVAPPEELAPLTGIEPGAADSDVKIAAVPPDIEALLPAERIPPSATIEIGRFHADLRPAIDTAFDARRIYQQAEVDQVPRAIVRVAPPVSPAMFGQATMLRVTLLLVIDTRGRVESTRIMTSSGNGEFDELVARTVRDDWIFSAAVKRGKAVRCLAQQAFRVTLPGGTPFSLE